jgi:hypothetical protein
VLTKRKEDGYSSEYFGSIGLVDFKMSIKHTFPKDRTAGETSHMVRLDATEYNADNLVIRKWSVWRPYSTNVGRQDTTGVTNLNKALNTFLTAGNLTKLLNGES